MATYGSVKGVSDFIWIKTKIPSIKRVTEGINLCRGERIRTSDPLLPKQDAVSLKLYLQAELNLKY